MLETILNSFWFMTWFDLWWKFLLADIVVEVIALCLMFKYLSIACNNNLEEMISFAEKEKAASSNKDKSASFTTLKGIIYILFPVVMFLHDAVSVVKNLSSYERFLNYCENNSK